MNARMAVIFFVLIAVAVLIVIVSFDPKSVVQQLTPTASAPQPGVCGGRVKPIYLRVGATYTRGQEVPWTYMHKTLGVLPQCQPLFVERLPGTYTCIQVASPDFRGWRWYQETDEDNPARVLGERYFPTTEIVGGTQERDVSYYHSSYHTDGAMTVYFRVLNPYADMRLVAVTRSDGCPQEFN